MTPRTWTVGDLRDVPKGVFQHCLECGATFGALYADYQSIQDDSTPLMCCGEPVTLASKVSTWIEYRPADDDDAAE